MGAFGCFFVLQQKIPTHDRFFEKQFVDLT